MRLNINGSILVKKEKKKRYFEENEFNERFGECLVCLHKIPINVESHMYEVAN